MMCLKTCLGAPESKCFIKSGKDCISSPDGLVFHFHIFVPHRGNKQSNTAMGSTSLNAPSWHSPISTQIPFAISVIGNASTKYII